MGRTMSIYEKPLIYRENGGGGNRTRVAAPADCDYMQDFYRRVVSDADNLFSGPATSLYAIEEVGGAVKIGVGRDPRVRIETFQVANWRRLSLIFACPATAKLEQFIHRELVDWRISGEWFKWAPRVSMIVEEFLSASEILLDIEELGDGPCDVDDTRGICELRSDPEFWEFVRFRQSEEFEWFMELGA